MQFHNFYDVFTSMKDNDKNHIDYLLWNGSGYETIKKTFQEMYCDISKCYSNLVSQGIKASSIVGLEIENTYEFLVCDSALLLIGAQTIISNGREKEELLDERLTSFQTEYVITNRKSVNLSQKQIAAASLLKEDGSTTMIELQPDENDEKDISIMFSSGTTGIPKALGITKQGSLWSSNNFFHYMEFTPEDKFMIFMPLSNYQQRFLSWGCIMNHVNISLGNELLLFHSLKLLEPSILLAAPNFFYNLSYEQNKNGKSKNDVLKSILGNKMRYLLTGMAPIDNNILEFYRDAEMEIYQIYGQTEIGMICCNKVGLNKIGSVGKPIIDVEIQQDELITNSPNPIVSGYYIDGKLDRMEKRRATGDLCKMDEEGFFYVNGRKNDTMVLNNGKKINPASIEQKIKGLFDIKDVVIYKKQTNDDKFVLNIVVLYDKGNVADFTKIEEYINKMGEIQSATDKVEIQFYLMKEEDKKTMYTENGKFSRAKAIDTFQK
ncbi:AMP-binding protein [Anaeromicropila populeti]|uniref:Long-chain acyl-CoA synthetase (AMP-forming) n=1 Tax=Anaeromicropila populeti TaxID=37658 RepID=A0A1I6HSN3_9FIRM|nr:AMP-binding protein [Anaeromicropila populeti]SFR57472.1 Long-chain acyl-CoA synthetase (AMP-forming) [Anaeromicropila populeti]